MVALGKLAQPPGMVVVQMGDDQSGDVLGLEANPCQGGSRFTNDRPVPAPGLDVVIAGVDQDDLFA
jgi:hypothetical protein